MKMIDLLDTHYIIVDDSEIKEGDWVMDFTNYGLLHQVWQISENHFTFKDSFHARGLKSKNRNLKYHFKKITYSTQPLGTPLLFTNAFESELSLSINGLNETFIENWGCKKLSLSEVEELINGYNLEKMAEKEFPTSDYILESDVRIERNIYKRGFQAHQELVKDMFILTKDQIEMLIEQAREHHGCMELEKSKQYLFKSISPKTEWDVEFYEQGKLRLI